MRHHGHARVDRGVAEKSPTRTWPKLALALLIVCAAGAPAFAVERRLPRTVTPERYAVSVKPDTDRRTFEGSVTIDVHVHQRTATITLNAADLALERATVAKRGPQGAEEPRQEAIGIVQDANLETATFTFAQPIAPGRHRLAIDYRGKIFDKAQGLFALTYDTERATEQMLVTQFEPADARRFLPCWDEPDLKAIFALSVIVPQDRTAISNMPVAATETLAGDLKRVSFEPTPKMSSYLLFLAIGDLDRREIDVDGTRIGAVTRRGDIEKAGFALESAAKLLRYYNEYFGIPFPLPKLDLIAAPGAGDFGFRAMENWGAILYFEDVLLLDPRLSAESDRQRVFTVIAHEIAHQWFGNLVTMRWWNDLWLNEGFANWMENKATDHFHPHWRIWLQTEATRQRAMRQDAMRTTHPIVQEVVSPDQIPFDNITYEKSRGGRAHAGGLYRSGRLPHRGAGLYAQIRLPQCRDRPAPDRAGIGRRQADQGNPAQLHAATGRAPRRQSIGNVPERPAGPVARSAAFRSGRRIAPSAALVHAGDRAGRGIAGAGHKFLLTDAAQITLPRCAPVKINAGQTGYFRSAYSPSAFKALSIRFAELDAADQLGLLYDAWALGEAGSAPVADYLELTRKPMPTTDPVVWRGLIQTFSDIDALYAGLPQRDTFRSYARAILAPVFAHVGWDAKPREADNVAVLREDLLTALGRLGDRAITTEARRRFDDFLRDSSTLPGAIWRATLEVVGQHADATTYDTLRGLARSTRNSLEKQRLYDALALAQDPALAARTLDLALSDEIRSPATSLSMIGKVALDNPDLAWRFVLDNFDRIKDKFVAEQRATFAPSLAALSSDPARLAELRGFIDREVPPDARPKAEIFYSELAFRLRTRDQRLPEIDRWLAGAGVR